MVSLNGNQARVAEAAERVFGDSDFAHKWLTLPNPALKDRIPLEVAKTDAGTQEVEAALTRIAHGVYI
jgi:putative toxin-antitoxin system antitoxin component (TIGR02293 family)